MSRVVFFLASSGFIASIVAHLGSIFELEIAKSEWFYTLHGAMFLVWFLFIICEREEHNRENWFKRITKSVNKKYIVFGVVLSVYIFLNFFAFMAKSDGGAPDIWDGNFVLQSHGKLLRNITESEYHSYKFNQLRGFSGVWLAFFYTPMVYFYFRARNA